MLLLLKFPFNTARVFGTVLGSVAGHFFTLSNRHISSRKRLFNLVDTDCKDLVVYGSNLSSTVGFSITKKVRINTALPSHIEQMITGLLLSDGYLRFGKGCQNASFKFTQSVKNLPYFVQVFGLLSHYCSSMPYLESSLARGNLNYNFRFETRAYPVFTSLRNIWYPDGTKLVPDTIYNYLSPLALAHWAQGDGSKQSTGFVLCTESFSYSDVCQLISILLLRYQLKCSITSSIHGPRIYIRTCSAQRFSSIVRPYFHPSMLYKLH
jgi:hypothetical protein